MLKLREAQNKILLFLFRNLALNRQAFSQILHATFENIELQSLVVYFCLSILCFSECNPDSFTYPNRRGTACNSCTHPLQCVQQACQQALDSMEFRINEPRTPSIVIERMKGIMEPRRMPIRLAPELEAE
jgi:hypothetical protein